MISRFVILGLLFLASSALHVEHNQATDFSSASYTQAISDLSTFQKEVAANTQYSTHITDIADFTKYLERTLNSELADLETYESEIIPSVAITPSSCSNLTNTESQQLIKKLECALDKTKNLTDYFSTLDNATLQQDLYRRANLQYLYLQQIKVALQNQCKSVQTISTSAIFYNFNNSAQNWVYGTNVTFNDVATLYQQLAQHGTVTICPADKPYLKVGTTQCLNCYAPTPIFDLTKQACSSCPGNTTLNTTHHQCECPCDIQYFRTQENLCIPKQVVYSNGNYLNLAGLTPDSIQRYVEEIAQAQKLPEVAAGKCASDENSAFSVCVKCPAGQSFIVDYKRCQECPFLDPATKVCSYQKPSTNSTSTPVTSPQTVTTVTTTTIVEPATTPISVQPISVQPISVAPTTTSTTTSTNSVAPMSTAPTASAPSTTGTTSTGTTSTGTTSTTSATTSFMLRPTASNVNAFDRIFASDPSAIEVEGPQCGPATPFFTNNDSQLCIDCPAYFNWDTKKCGTCPDGAEPIANMCL